MEELIEYAKNRLDDACKNGTYEDCIYWVGYLDCAKKVKKKWEEQKENLISEMKKHIKNN